MDAQSQMTRPYGHDQVDDPIRIHHPEEEEHHEKGASKVLKKVKEKAKKIKNTLTKGHGHEHDHDVDEEDYEYDEDAPEVHGAPMYESSVMRGGVTGKPESLSHGGETNIPAPEEIIPPGTKVFPVVSSDYTKPIEPVSLHDTSYGDDAPSYDSYPIRPTGILDREERRDEPTHHPLNFSVLSDREEIREAHYESLNAPASLLSPTEDVTTTFAPGAQDEYLRGKRNVNVERPKRFEEDPVAPGGGSGLRRDVPTRHTLVSDLSDREERREAHHDPLNVPVSLLSATEDVTRTFGPGGEDEYLVRQGKFSVLKPKRFEEDPAVPGGSDNISGESNYQCKVTDPTGKSGSGVAGIPEIAESLGRMKVTDESPDKKPGSERDLPTKSHDFGLKNESGISKESTARYGKESRAELGGDFPTRSRQSGLKTEAGIGKDSLTYSSESGTGLQENLPTRSDNVKVETELGRDIRTGSHDQFSPELSRPKERNDFDETKDETTQKTKPNTYTEQIASATSALTNKAIAAKDAVASKLGFSGASGSESHVIDETPRSATGYGQNVAGNVVEKLTPVYKKVKDTGSNVITKLPLSGGGNLEETQQGQDKTVSARDYLSEKLKPGKEDKALSEVITEKLHFGGGDKKTTTTTKEMEVTVEKIPTDEILGENEDVLKKEVNVRGGERGMVGKMKGAVTSWIGGTKPKSHDSGEEESSQSLGSTVGTTGFKDTSGGSEAVQVQRGLDN